MIVNKLNPNIIVVEDFVDVGELAKIINFSKTLPETSWYSEEHKEDSFWHGKQYKEYYVEVLNALNQKVKKISETAFYIPDIRLQRHVVGQHMGVHKDNVGVLADTGAHVDYGIVIYYNDDYSGGEIVYPELDIEYKPKAGSLVVHKSDIFHFTKPVITGTRYFSTSFIFQKENTLAELNPNIFG